MEAPERVLERVQACANGELAGGVWTPSSDTKTQGA